MKESAAPTSASAYAWYVAGLLCVAHILSMCDRFLMSLVFDLIKAELMLSDTQLGMIHGLGFVILFAILTLPVGRLADIIDRRLLIAGGIIVWSLATALTGLATDFYTMFGARLLVGVGEAALVPAALAMLAGFFPRTQLGRAASIFAMGAPLGRGVALLGGGALLAVIAAHGTPAWMGLPQSPWRALFILASFAGLPVAMLVFGLRASHSDGVRQPKATLRDTFAYIARNRGAYATVTLAYALQTVLITALGAWNISYLRRTFDLPIGTAGMLAGIVGLGIAPLGSLFGGWLSDRIQASNRLDAVVWIMSIGAAGVIVSITVLGFTNLLAIALIAYAATQFLLSMSGPATLAAIQIVTPAQFRGFATSIYFVGVGVISAFGPLMVGMMSDAAMPLGMALMWLGIGLMSASLTIALIGRKTYQRCAEQIAVG